MTGRSLPNEVTTPGGPAYMTIALCTSSCQAAGYVLAGAEYSEQCYCGNTFSNGGAPAPDGLAGCNMVCAGNLSELCGGPNRLDVYDLNNAIATITVSTSTPTATAPAIKPTISPYTYFGCQTEATGARALSAATFDSDSMTLELCEQFCNTYTYFGVEYGRECYCGNSFSAGSNATSDSDCSFLCPGNIYEFCGAGDRLSCYQHQ